MTPTAILGIPVKGFAKLKSYSTPHSLLMVNFSEAMVVAEYELWLTPQSIGSKVASLGRQFL